MYHFVAYVPFKGRVYELDGLQEGPILLGEITEDAHWIAVAREAILKRIAMYVLYLRKRQKILRKRDHIFITGDK